jgi:hypothetical protein
MRVSIDLDGVMCDFANPCNEWIAERLDEPLRPLAIWDFHTLYGERGDAAWKSFWKYNQDSDFMRNLNPIEGAIDGVYALLDRGIDIAFVTGRNRNYYEEDSEVWLAEHGLADIPLVFTRSKGELRSFNWYVDDQPAVLDSCLLQGKKVIAFLHDYNAFWYTMHSDDPHVWKGRSWPEVTRLLIEEQSLLPYRKKGLVND